MATRPLLTRSFSVQLPASNDRWNKVFLQTVTCPVCLELFKSPRNFPQCSHSLCYECMTKLPVIQCSNYVTNGDTVGYIECPICNVRNSVGPTGVSFFPVNAVAQQILDIVGDNADVFSPSKLALKDCPHLTTTHGSKTHCLHCSKSFCEACRDAHLEYLKSEILNTRDHWEMWRPSSKMAESAINDIVRQFDMDMTIINDQLNEAVALAVDTVKTSLEAQAGRLAREAQSIRERKFQSILQKFRTNYDTMSGAARLIDEQLDSVTRSPRDLATVAGLHKLVTDTIHQGIKNLESIKVAPRIKLTVPPSFADLLTTLADKIVLGALTVDKEPTSATSPVGSEEVRLESPVQRTPLLGRQMSINTPSPAGTLVDHVEVPVLESYTYDRIGLSEPTGIMYLKHPTCLLIPDGHASISAIQKPFEVNCIQRITVPDPDFTSSNQFIETNAKVVVDVNGRLFLLDIRRRRIVACDLAPDGSVCKRSIKVMTRGAVLEGLAINEARKELYTVQGHNRMLIFSTEPVGSSPKASCEVLKRARILGASETFGVVYRQPYHPIDGLTKLHFKRWPLNEMPPEDVTSFETRGFDLGLPLKGHCNSVEFDSNGNMLMVDAYEETIRIYGKPDKKGDVEWRYCCFLGDSLELEHPFDPIALTVVDNDTLAERYASNKIDPTSVVKSEIIVAVLDNASRSLMLLRLPAD